MTYNGLYNQRGIHYVYGLLTDSIRLIKLSPSDESFDARIIWVLYVVSIAALSRLGTLVVVRVTRLQCHYNNCVLPKPLSHLPRNQVSLRQLVENIFQMWKMDSLRLALPFVSNCFDT